MKRREYEYSVHHCKQQIRLYNSLEKYKWKNHTFEIIEECEFLELNKRERYWQDYYNVIGKNGLNCVLQETDILPKIMSKEARLNMSKGSTKYWLGKTLTEEHKRKIGLLHKGSKRSKETKKKMRYNSQSKIVLNIETGIYYECIRDASESINMNYDCLKCILNGSTKTNNTNLLVV